MTVILTEEEIDQLTKPRRQRAALPAPAALAPARVAPAAGVAGAGGWLCRGRAGSWGQKRPVGVNLPAQKD